MPRKCLNLALSAALLMLLSARADAGITTWDLSNVFFDDSTQATGSLTFQSFGKQVFDLLTWDVTTVHIGEFLPIEFTPANSFFTFTDIDNLVDPEVELAWGGGETTFTMVMAGFDLPASGTLDLATRTSPFVDGRGFSYTSFEAAFPTVFFEADRQVVSGSLVLESASVPEPSTWIIFGSVLLILAARNRRGPPKLC
jgi:hypothetical protein